MIWVTKGMRTALAVGCLAATGLGVVMFVIGLDSADKVGSSVGGVCGLLAAGFGYVAILQARKPQPSPPNPDDVAGVTNTVGSSVTVYGSVVQSGSAAPAAPQTDDPLGTTVGSTVIAGENSGVAVTAGPGAVIGSLHVNASRTSDGDAPAKPVVGHDATITNLWSEHKEFTGRSRELAEIAARLDDGPVAVCGLGGVGKSQLVLRYANQGRVNGKYRITWRLRAESAVTLADDLVDLAGFLGVPIGQSQQKAAKVALAELTNQTDWLLIYDNASHATPLTRWLPRGPGHILITSREQGWRHLATPIDLVGFTPAEAESLLQASTGRDETDAALRLAEELGYLPLALAQAAAYIDKHNLSIGSYVELAQDHRAAAVLLTKGLDPHDDSTAVATTWLIHFEELKSNLAALQLLRLCAFLSPDEIPLDLLLANAELLPEELAKSVATPLGRTEVIGVLVQTFLVTRIDNETVQVHRLVQAVTRQQLGQTDHSSWADIAANLVAAILPDSPFQASVWPKAARLASHALAVVTYAQDRIATINLLQWLGLYRASRRETELARDLLQRVLDMKEATLPSGHPAIAHTLNDLSTVHLDLGAFGAARDLLRRALEIFEEFYPEKNHPDIASALLNLSNVYQCTGELDEAHKVLCRALIIRRETCPEYHPEIAKVVLNLGLVHRELGELGEARDLLSYALVIFNDVHPEDHPDIAGALADLGSVFFELGELGEAQLALHGALAIFKDAYPEGHPDVAGVMLNLGLVYHDLGYFDQAYALLWYALIIRQKTYSGNHPDIASTLVNLGYIRQSQGELGEARDLVQRGLSILKKAYPVGHPRVAKAMAILGYIYRGLGKIRTARKVLRRALTSYKTAYPENHPDVASALRNLGLVHRSLGEIHEARRLLERALAIFRRNYPSGHRAVAETLIDLGQVNVELGERSNALSVLSDALTASEEAYGADHEATVSVRRLLGELAASA